LSKNQQDLRNTEKALACLTVSIYAHSADWIVMMCTGAWTTLTLHTS